jgi:hypothetical protein
MLQFNHSFGSLSVTKKNAKVKSDYRALRVNYESSDFDCDGPSPVASFASDI